MPPCARPFLYPLAIALLLVASSCASGAGAVRPVPTPAGASVRVAVYNIFELSGEKLDRVDEAGRGADTQAAASALVLQTVRPDIVAILEIDHNYTVEDAPLGHWVDVYQDNYLAHGDTPLRYPYVFVAPNNTGILSGVDMDANGRVAGAGDMGTREYGGDSFGYGTYPGQYSMALLSRFPIDEASARTFQEFLWQDLPGNNMPAGWYPDGVAEVLRLSSKSHWDVPVVLPPENGGRSLHILVSHPTPQGFDGPEDRNGRRNYDEIALWWHYLDDAAFLVDDAGVRGGLDPGAPFVLVGDLNAEPGRGAYYQGSHAMDRLLAHPRITDPVGFQWSHGARAGVPAGPPDHPERATFRDRRIDFALPSAGLAVTGGGVYWPSVAESVGAATVSEFASDHRLVWVDVDPGTE